jgi:hypothetical protein
VFDKGVAADCLAELEEADDDRVLETAFNAVIGVTAESSSQHRRED